MKLATKQQRDRAHIEKLIASGQIKTQISWEPVTWEYKQWLATQQQKQIAGRVAEKQALNSLRQLFQGDKQL